MAPRIDRDDPLQQEMALDRKQAVLLRAKAFDRKLTLTGFEDPATRDLILANQFLREGQIRTLRPLLPLLLTLKGRPYRLHDYFPFEPFFRTRMAKSTLLKTGRQVSKSTSLAAQGVVFSNSIPYFSTLYVTPLFEMIRRFSHNYVRTSSRPAPCGGCSPAAGRRTRSSSGRSSTARPCTSRTRSWTPSAPAASRPTRT
jgi:hypothetical protein